MLTKKQMTEYKQMQDLAIVEIAGRDSVAAAISAVKQKGCGNMHRASVGLKVDFATAVDLFPVKDVHMESMQQF